MAGKKSRVLEEILDICLAKNDFVFHNNLVKDISQKQGWANPFDATKLDNTNKLPPKLHDLDYAVVHLGNGYHQFVRGIDKIYHKFEPIQQTIDWPYTKSLLNNYHSKECNMLSMANNQRILHHFLFGKSTGFNDVNNIKRPKTYFPHNIITSYNYFVGKEIHIDLHNLKTEIGLTIEYQGNIGIFNARIKIPNNFIISQLYYQYLHYNKAKERPELIGTIKSIDCVFMAYNKARTNKNQHDKLLLWAYTFENPLDITSIKLVNSACYKLIEE